MPGERPTRDRALSLVATARTHVKLHPDFFWAATMADLADMIDKLVDQLTLQE